MAVISLTFKSSLSSTGFTPPEGRAYVTTSKLSPKPSPPLLKRVLWLSFSQTTIWSPCCKLQSLSHSSAAPLALQLPEGYTKHRVHLPVCWVHLSSTTVPMAPRHTPLCQNMESDSHPAGHKFLQWKKRQTRKESLCKVRTNPQICSQDTVCQLRFNSN